MSISSEFYVIVGYDLSDYINEKYYEWQDSDDAEKYFCSQIKDEIQLFNDPMDNNYLYFGYVLSNGKPFEFDEVKFDVEKVNELKCKVQQELMKLIISGVIKKDAYLKGKCQVIVFEEIS